MHAAHGAGQLFGIEGKTRADLGFAFAVDHVDKPFRRGEGELAVEEGALGELAPLRQAAAQREGAAEDTPRDARAAVAVQLHHVFAREAVRGLEVDAEAEIGKAAAVDAARHHAVGFKVFDGGLAGGEKHFFRHGKRAAAAQAHDRHAPLAGRGGDGGDVVVQHSYDTSLHDYIISGRGLSIQTARAERSRALHLPHLRTCGGR